MHHVPRVQGERVAYGGGRCRGNGGVTLDTDGEEVGTGVVVDGGSLLAASEGQHGGVVLICPSVGVAEAHVEGVAGCEGVGDGGLGVVTEVVDDGAIVDARKSGLQTREIASDVVVEPGEVNRLTEGVEKLDVLGVGRPGSTLGSGESGAPEGGKLSEPGPDLVLSRSVRVGGYGSEADVLSEFVAGEGLSTYRS